MTESHLALLNASINKPARIETRAGERLIAKVISVFNHSAYDQHEIFYKLLSSNLSGWYANQSNAGGYALDFADIVSVAPLETRPPLTAHSLVEPESHL